MVDAESKVKKGRIRHLYPRKEIYHLFIHSDEYYYTPYNSRSYNSGQISCKGNYLVIGDIGRKNTIEDIEEMWYYNSNRMIAIIDRFYKRILINKNYSKYAYELEAAIPDDYIIYHTDETIPNKDILKETEQCCKIHLKYTITQFVEHGLKPYYNILYGNQKTIYNTCDYSDYWYYKCLEEFVNKYNIKKYSIYKECFNDKYKIRLGYNYLKPNYKIIKLPTVKQIITNTIFTKKEKLLIEQRAFYTKYCYGRGIPFKDVVKNWNKEVNRNDIIKYLNKVTSVEEQWFDTENTWNEYIIKAATVIDNIYKQNIQGWIEQSNRNELKAIEYLKQNKNYSIDDWREYKPVPRNTTTYRKFIAPHTKNGCVQWVDAPISLGSKIVFDNIQLRLTKDKKYIETSNYARVPIEDGIRMYKFFNNLRSIDKDTKQWTTSDFGNIKVGIYNLRFIQYKEKTTANKTLGYKEWLIQIGCHSLWLDDVNNFIQYYHLEKEFGLDVNNNNK